MRLYMLRKRQRLWKSVELFTVQFFVKIWSSSETGEGTELLNHHEMFGRPIWHTAAKYPREIDVR